MPEEKPILFNAEMVRAVLDGRKTQTRRVVKPQPEKQTEWFKYLEEGKYISMNHILGIGNPTSIGNAIKCPYGSPGDELWVRETWMDAGKEIPGSKHGEIWYKANDCEEYAISCEPRECRPKWKPSIHMPRWASRIQLRVKDVRVERVQDISEEDARSEGVRPNWCGELSGWDPDEHGFMCQEGIRHWEKYPESDWDGGYHRTGKEAFESLWDSINEKRGFGWEKNPWVWVVEFERIK